LYSPVVDSSKFYNVSLGSAEIDPNSGLPFGFFHHPMEGLSDGYPVLVSSAISEKRALQTLQYIQHGGLLNSETTSSLLLQMVTYNPIAVAFGLFHATLKWLDSGSIIMTLTLKVLGLSKAASVPHDHLVDVRPCG
jgi:hypothetical protein